MPRTAESRMINKTTLTRTAHGVAPVSMNSTRVDIGNLRRRDRVASYPVVERTSWAGAAERSLDIAFALTLGVVFSPVIVAATVALGISDGPIMFKQPRLGQGGKIFHVYKFRTMVPNAKDLLEDILDRDPELRKEWETTFKLKNDPRVTPIGRFLRKTSLDELPQLLNILKGEMSLVGPRPIEPFEITKYGRFAKHYFAQRPGLTGLWQVSGRSDSSYERRVILDAYYSKNRSLMLNLSIIAKTVRVVLKGSGAY